MLFEILGRFARRSRQGSLSDVATAAAVATGCAIRTPAIVANANAPRAVTVDGDPTPDSDSDVAPHSAPRQ